MIRRDGQRFPEPGDGLVEPALQLEGGAQIGVSVDVRRFEVDGAAELDRGVVESSLRSEGDAEPVVEVAADDAEVDGAA